MPDATDTMRSLLNHEDANIQLKAATKLIELGLKARERCEHDSKLEQNSLIVNSKTEICHISQVSGGARELQAERNHPDSVLLDDVETNLRARPERRHGLARIGRMTDSRLRILLSLAKVPPALDVPGPGFFDGGES